MRYGYARVSKREQNLNLQLDALRKAGVTKIFRDKVSATKADRPGLTAALKTVRTGDQLVVYKLDRFARDLLDQMLMLRDLQRKGASLISLTEGIDTGDWMSDIMSRQLGIYSEMELHRIRERTRAGLAAARARGKILGRRRKLTPSQIAEARQKMQGGMKAQAVASFYGVGRSTLFRNLRER